MDLHQLWTIISLPDNVPIVLLLFVVPFYTWYGLRQAFANDRLIAQLEADPVLAKTHHRKTQPWRPEWSRDVHVWPYLLRIEFLAAIIVTLILMVWSITLNAPLEEPANPTLTMNPSKAPWYFLGLQEMLVYFDPWIAGVVMPTLIIIGLMAIPYIDANPLGNGYYTYKQRKSAIWTFIFGFIILWVTMIVIGTLIRGPGWMWFWPGQTWDHNRLEFAVNRDLHEILERALGFRFGMMGRILFGGFVTTLYAVGAAILIHKLITWTPFNRKIYARMSLLQYVTLQILLISMLALPVKMILRLVFTIKYVWVTPWFNV
jgi:Cytochrome b(C-terminal)/b6/petD